MKSVWACWPALRKQLLAADDLLLFLDYDGTLAPIAEHPSKARLPALTRRLLERIARLDRMQAVVISGRSLRDVRSMVGVAGIGYVGNHGLEVSCPELRYVNPVALRSRGVMRELAGRLKQAVGPIPGAWVEDKKYTLSVHFRQVAPADALLVKNAFYETVEPYLSRRQARVSAGKEVFEVRPPCRWTKGTIANWLLARRAAAAGAQPLPVYMGDDQTDEDAFEALGGRGVTIMVGSGALLTKANYLVRSPKEVQRLLSRLLALGKAKEKRHAIAAL